MQHPPERLGEHLVGDRVRGGEVHGPVDVVLEQEPDGADLVGEADPAHPLLAGAELAQQAEAGQAGEPLEHAAGPAQHDAGADPRHPDARRGGRLGGGLPGHGHVGEEARARRAGLGELLVVPVAVDADGRAGHEHRRLGGQRGQRVREQGRALACGSRGSCASARRSSASRRCPRRRGGPRRRGPRGPAASMCPASMSQRTVSGAAVADRTTRIAVCPSASRESHQRAPDQPARPGDRDAHQGYGTGRACGSIPGGIRAGRLQEVPACAAT